VLIQTRYPQHPLYGSVVRHDYDNFATALLEERQQARLPPFCIRRCCAPKRRSWPRPSNS
jgi:primosomal protein N'